MTTYQLKEQFLDTYDRFILDINSVINNFVERSGGMEGVPNYRKEEIKEIDRIVIENKKSHKFFFLQQSITRCVDNMSNAFFIFPGRFKSELRDVLLKPEYSSINTLQYDLEQVENARLSDVNVVSTQQIAQLQKDIESLQKQVLLLNAERAQWKQDYKILFLENQQLKEENEQLKTELAKANEISAEKDKKIAVLLEQLAQYENLPQDTANHYRAC